MTNLRARQRLQTSDEIRRVAVDLVHKHGLDHVTTEMIAEAAGVSPRTFFNYFPYKEAALVPTKNEFTEEAIAIFLSAPGTLEKDLAALIIPAVSGWHKDQDMMRKLFEIAESHPKLSALKATSVHEHEMGLRTLMALRLEQKENDFFPMLIAAVVTSALRVAMENWAHGNEETSAEYIRRSLTGIRTMFNPQ